MLQICWVDFAEYVVPLACSATCTKHISTFLQQIVWFITSPSSIPFCQWSIINPVELIVGFADKTEPRTPGCYRFLFLYQIEYEVILGS